MTCDLACLEQDRIRSLGGDESDPFRVMRFNEAEADLSRMSERIFVHLAPTTGPQRQHVESCGRLNSRVQAVPVMLQLATPVPPQPQRALF